DTDPAASSSFAPPGRRVPQPGAMRQESVSVPASRMTEQNDRPERPNLEAHAPKIEVHYRNRILFQPCEKRHSVPVRMSRHPYDQEGGMRHADRETGGRRRS